MKREKKAVLTGSDLKWLAILTMVIDHCAAILLAYGLLPKIANAVLAGNSFDYVVEDYHFWYSFNEICRMIGRIAFPLFAFLLVEGFLHTKNVRNYALRLGLFAIISEVPFDLALSGNMIYLGWQNIFFTLLIGLLMLHGLKYFEETLPATLAPLRYIVPLTGIVASYFLQTDHGGFGVLLIFLLYEFRHNKKLQCIGGAALTLFDNYTGWIAFLFIFFYNGTRGKHLPKYIFYAFYPAHILLLYFLRLLIIT